LSVLILSLCTRADYRCHVFVRSDSLACVVIADHDYPSRVCFTLMNKVREHINSSHSLALLGDQG